MKFKLNFRLDYDKYKFTYMDIITLPKHAKAILTHFGVPKWSKYKYTIAARILNVALSVYNLYTKCNNKHFFV